MRNLSASEYDYAGHVLQRIGPFWLFIESSEDEDGVSARILPLRCSLSAEAALDQQTRRCQALGRHRIFPNDRSVIRPVGALLIEQNMSAC